MHTHQSEAPETVEAVTDRLVEESVTRAVFGSEMSRRRFFRLVGERTALAALASVFPLGCAKQAVKETTGVPNPKGLEKPDLTIGFLPITCAAPIIMAKPLGFYQKFGLNVNLYKGSGWAVVRDLAINKEVDAAHMLSPMPLALTLGLGAQKTPFVMPTVCNLNGDAITLHNKHRNVRAAEDMKGFRLCVPFDYSIHNLLLRYFLADGGVDPDKDVQIRVVPPPQMLANLKAENVDGYITADPFNQRAVYENVGFLYKLSRDIWPGHPCCAFAASQDFVTQNPKTFGALFSALVASGMYAHDKKNRKEVAAAIAPGDYLNQPVELVEQVLTGVYPNGLGQTVTTPDRIDYYPFPYESMAVWILTQLKRWGYIQGDVDYQQVASQVYLASGCRKVMEAQGFKAPDHDSVKAVFTIGRDKVFDPSKPQDYVDSFPIKKVS